MAHIEIKLVSTVCVAYHALLEVDVNFVRIQRRIFVPCALVVRPTVTVGVGPDKHLQRLTGWNEVEIALNPLDGGTSRRAAEAIEPGHVLLIGADAILGGAVVDAEDHQFVELAIVRDGVVVAIGRDAVGDFTGVDQAIFIAIEILNLATVNFAVVVAVVFIQLALVRNSVLVAVLTLTKVDVTSIRNPVANRLSSI